MADTAIIIIEGAPVLASLNRGYNWKHQEWESQCAGVRGSFKKKTSRMVKGEKEYEYTKWYRIKGDYGGLECVGKEEPDYSKYYPPEPKPAYSFKVTEYGGHLILEQKDYVANQKLFKDCLAFRLEDCQNRIHPLYKNPEKALQDSVRKPGVSSARPAISGGTEYGANCKFKDTCDIMGCPPDCTIFQSLSGDRVRSGSGTEKEDMCRGDGEHQDECPVSAENVGELEEPEE